MEQQVLTSCTRQASTICMVDDGKKTSEPIRDQGATLGGVIPGSGGQPAFALLGRPVAPIPVLIAVPHAGRTYPAPLLAAMRNPAEACLRLEDRLADMVGRAVARKTGAMLLVADAPRALIDLNRAPEDMDWEMVAGAPPRGSTRFAAGRRARSGLGLVPRRLAGMGELWFGQISRQDLDERIDHVHRPYHAALAASLESLRDRWGGALLIDLHSMPPLGPKTGADPAADFVVGDRYGSSCAGRLSTAAIESLQRSGMRTAHNQPYAGGYVLDRHSAPQRGLHAVQIEMCRTIYLDTDLREPAAGFARTVDVVAELVRHLADELSGGWRAMPQAAE